MPTSAGADKIGQTLGGRYELVELLRELGEIGEFAATDLDGTQYIVTTTSRFSNKEAFRASSKTLRTLEHRGLTPVIAAGYDDDLECGYIVEPPIKGRLLAEVIEKDAPISPDAISLLGLEVAEALKTAHAAGVVHGSVEPSLISVGERGARLRGFGRTETGDGTSPYAAPELSKDSTASPSTDVYALARCMIHAASGKLENEGTAQQAAPWLEPQLAAALDGATLEDPALRCANAQEFYDALKALTKGDAPLSEALLTTATPKVQSLPAPAARPITSWADATISDRDVGASDPPDSQSVMELLVGQTIDGRFELEELLGEGGMGAVFRAKADDGRLVALKLMRPESTSGDSLRRFLREARGSMQIQSPHMVKVFEAGSDPGRNMPFIVMELLNGKDLSATLDEVGALNPGIAARIFVDACRGVAAAHEAGLIHRDIKPANIFLHRDEAGTIVTKICDFGVAKHASVLDQTATALTRTGGILGSPAYMSPEQAQDSKNVDARTDVWSLAISLYEAVSGRQAWAGCSNVGELMAWLFAKEVPPIQDAAPWIQPDLASTIHRGLIRNPSERVQSAAEFGESLESFATPIVTADVLEPIQTELRSRTARRVLAGPGATGGALTSGARQSEKSPRKWWIAAGLVTIGSAAAITLVGREDSSIADPPAARIECSSRADCSEISDSAWCNPEGACVALETAQCRVLAEEDALESSETLWIGTMFPISDSDYGLFGKSSEQAVDLARRDFLSVAGGLPRTNEASRPLGIVACDDTVDAAEAARHLALQVKTPAVIGFRSSREVSELATNVFIPNNVLVLAALNQSDIISSIPHPSDGERLVWRTAARTSQSGSVIGKIVGLLEDETIGARPIRVALVRVHHATGLTQSKAITNNLAFNGKTALEQGSNFLELVYDAEGSNNDVSSLAERLRSFDPDIAIVATFAPQQTQTLLEASGLATSAARIIVSGSIEGPLADWLANHPAAASRVYGLSPPASTPVNIAFTRDYNAAFAEKLTPELSPGAPYDAYYLAALAAYAAGDVELSGEALAKGIGRLVQGRPISVGATEILEAIGELQAGRTIDLQGAFSRMDFDLETGETPADFAILCAKVEDDGTVRNYESGMIYDAAKDELVGELQCDR